jgi:Fe-S-cluster-containing hydrogenase component 2
MRKIFTFFVIAGFLFAIPACHFSNEEDLIPQDGCITDAISFSADVTPILQNSCVSCHNSSNPSGGVELDDYNGISAVAGNGSLSGSVNHKDGYSPMPQGMPKLDSCDIARIDAWIADGFPDN